MVSLIWCSQTDKAAYTKKYLIQDHKRWSQLNQSKRKKQGYRDPKNHKEQDESREIYAGQFQSYF